MPHTAFRTHLAPPISLQPSMRAVPDIRTTIQANADAWTYSGMGNLATVLDLLFRQRAGRTPMTFIRTGVGLFQTSGGDSRVLPWTALRAAGTSCLPRFDVHAGRSAFETAVLSLLDEKTYATAPLLIAGCDDAAFALHGISDVMPCISTTGITYLNTSFITVAGYFVRANAVSLLPAAWFRRNHTP